jgi:hypothetical protein
MSRLDRRFVLPRVLLACAVLALPLTTCLSSSIAQEPGDATKKLLAEIRADMARRELDAAKKKLDQAARLTEPPEDVAEVERL